jgi:hypothetical protein
MEPELFTAFMKDRFIMTLVILGIFGFFGCSKPAAKNTIVNLKTEALQSKDGPVTAIVMGLDMPDQDNADAFIQQVVEKFKVQRMCSSPDTSVLLITLVSDMPASRFVKRWRQLAADDKVLGFFMSQMRIADVVRGKVVGQTLETVSLLHEPSS